MAYQSASLNRLLDFLVSYGVFEVALPFLLIFTIVFAVLQQVKIFGNDKKNINGALALLFGLIAVVPHITGRYPPNYDPIVIINALIPSAAVLAISIVLVLILLGMWGLEMGKGVPTFAIIVIVGVLFYVFGATVGWWQLPSQVDSWWDDDLTSLIVVILVFGAIIWFITSDDKSTGFKDFAEELFKRRR
ncbi:MAG TPA: hypothetical protein VJH88_01440 [Candidatus Nanoarchaeia archaeon]|nr:hypothetical protein [Candidatus Nanoarchaeia archaeon]